MAESWKYKQHNEDEDKISNLPDALLINILSFVSSKTSVQTSTLSSRWRHIWQHLSVLNLSDDDFIQNNSEPFKHFRRFFYFVNSLIYVLKLSKVDKMRLSCTKSLTVNRLCKAALEAWIRSVMGPFLKELHLTLYTTDGYSFQPPFRIFECSNLVSLSLEGAFEFQQYIRLPSLKKLELGPCAIDLASLNAFLHGCPCLETLDLYLHDDDVPPLCLPSSLKRLKIVLNSQVLILDYLSINDAASNVSPFTLLNLKHLGFSRSSTKWLLGDVTHPHFPNFGHLLHLNLNLFPFNSNSLMSLLQKCHSLQVLIIQNDREVCHDKEQEESSLPKWAVQSIVPSCLESHLSYIQFKGYRGFTDELYFVEYILQKGRVLKTMIIVEASTDLKEKFDTHKRLSNVPKASRICQLSFE